MDRLAIEIVPVIGRLPSESILAGETREGDSGLPSSNPAAAQGLGITAFSCTDSSTGAL
jgi:hypothetical protein